MIRTKIIATVGPASDSPEVLGSMINAGVDVFRLNLSHGTREQHARIFERIPPVCGEREALIPVMADLCGAKVRVAQVEGNSFPIAPGYVHLDFDGNRLGAVERRAAQMGDQTQVPRGGRVETVQGDA